jgi:hypothetical protein
MVSNHEMDIYRQVWMLIDKGHLIQGICNEVCTILRGAEQIRVVIPDVNNGTMASLANVVAPVIQHIFSLCKC